MAYKGALMVDDDEMYSSFKRCAELGALPLVHAENGDVVAQLQQKLLAEGNNGPEAHAYSRPPEVEGEATNRAIMIADMAGAPLYVVHVSCEQAHEAIRRARQKGMRVFGEPLVQHLTLDEREYQNPDWDHAARRVMSPPFRDKAHQDSLWAGLQAGSLQVVATDHCAFTTKQKRFGVGDFTKIPNGTGGLEDRLPVLWTKGVNTGRLTMNEFVAVTSTNIAKILNMYPKKGAIVEGADADIVVWDPKRKKKITAKKQQSVIDYNVFEGFEVVGLPRFVFSRGELVIQEKRDPDQAGPRTVRRPRGEPAGQPRAVQMERDRGAAQGRAQRHPGRGLTLVGRASVVCADRLVARCRLRRRRRSRSTLPGPMAMATAANMPRAGRWTATTRCCSRPDGFESYGTACEFVRGAAGQGRHQGGDRPLPVRGRGRFRHAELRRSGRARRTPPRSPSTAATAKSSARSALAREALLPVQASGRRARRDAAAARRSPARWDRCAQ